MFANYTSFREKKVLQFTDFIKSSKNVCKSTIYKDFTVIGRPHEMSVNYTA